MTDRPFDPREPKLARYEGRKLFATTLNTIGLGVFGLGALTPAVTQQLDLATAFRMAPAGLTLFLMHRLAQRVLKRLED